jgi:hypothetical protein
LRLEIPCCYSSTNGTRVAHLISEFMVSQQTTRRSNDAETEAGACSHKANQESRPLKSAPLTPDPDRLNSEKKRPAYKSIPETWKTIPPGRYSNAIGHIEAVLLEISADGTTSSNPFDWKPSLPTLQVWADHLRSALRDLTRQSPRLESENPANPPD